MTEKLLTGTLSLNTTNQHPSRCPPGYPKQYQQIVKDQQEADKQLQLRKNTTEARIETVSNKLLGSLNRFHAAAILA